MQCNVRIRKGDFDRVILEPEARKIELPDPTGLEKIQIYIDSVIFSITVDDGAPVTGKGWALVVRWLRGIPRLGDRIA